MSATPQRGEPRGLRTQWRRAWSTRRAGAGLLSTGFREQLQAELGDLSDLRRVGSRPPLREYLTELWDRRHFIWAGARGEAMTKYSNERLGAAWFVLRPLLDAAFYWLIFGVVLQIGRGMENYVAFILIGTFLFQLSSRSISGGVTLIRSSKPMIRAFSFPRVALAVSSVIRDLMSAAPAILVMLVMIIAIPPHEFPSATWSLFPVILALHLVMNLGFALLFGWLGSLMPDLAQAMGFVTRLLMYGSAVIFPIEQLVDHPVVLAILHANPIFQLLQAYRAVLMDGAVPSVDTWILLSTWALGSLLLGFMLFWWNEERYGRD